MSRTKIISIIAVVTFDINNMNKTGNIEAQSQEVLYFKWLPR